MNWRGRPLTSHEVIVQTIAATTTRTGLQVRAELDPGSYPAGAEVSDEQLACLPLNRHPWHGDWNYTLRPEPPAPPPPRQSRGPEHPEWAHPALTGMTPAAWNQLISTLAIPHQIQHDIGLHLRRNGKATRKPSGGHPPALTLAEQTLITVLRQRFRPLQAELAELFGVVTGTIVKAEQQARPLLAQCGYTIQPAGTRLRTLADLTAYAREHGLELTPKAKPAC
jgi:hypothetical protein